MSDTVRRSAHDGPQKMGSRAPLTLDDAAWLALLSDLTKSGCSPLPLCRPPRPPRPQSKSPRLIHRWVRALRLWESSLLCVDTINDLGGVSLPPVPEARIGRLCAGGCRCEGGRLSEAHGRTHLRLIRGCLNLQEGRRLRPGGAGDDWRSALVRQPGDFYDLGDSIDRYEPFIADRIDEPCVGSPTVDAFALSPFLRGLYCEPNTVMRPGVEGSDDFKTVCKRFDRVLGAMSEYRRYFARPEVQPLWELAPASETRGPCTIAAVMKNREPFGKSSWCVHSMTY